MHNRRVSDNSISAKVVSNPTVNVVTLIAIIVSIMGLIGGLFKAFSYATEIKERVALVEQADTYTNAALSRMEDKINEMSRDIKKLIRKE